MTRFRSPARCIDVEMAELFDHVGHGVVDFAAPEQRHLFGLVGLRAWSIAVSSATISSTEYAYSRPRIETNIRNCSDSRKTSSRFSACRLRQRGRPATGCRRRPCGECRACATFRTTSSKASLIGPRETPSRVARGFSAMRCPAGKRRWRVTRGVLRPLPRPISLRGNVAGRLSVADLEVGRREVWVGKARTHENGAPVTPPTGAPRVRDRAVPAIAEGRGLR